MIGCNGYEGKPRGDRCMEWRRDGSAACVVYGYKMVIGDGLLSL